MNKEIRYLQKLRVKYAGNENAYDAIVYHMLTNTAPPGGLDIVQKIKRAMDFYATPDGEKAYAHFCGDKRVDQEGELYDYSNDLAKAAQCEGKVQRKNSSPELLAAEALERFTKTI